MILDLLELSRNYSRLSSVSHDRSTYPEAQLGLLLGGGGNILFCKGLGGFSKIFQKQKSFLKGLKSKKGNFKLLHADLAVFNSNRFFVLVFLQNLYFQQL